MKITIFPELSRNAISQKQAREYRLWTIMRAMDEKGTGWVKIQDVKEHWPQSDRNLSRTLALGDGTWWTLSKGRAFLKSAYKMGLRLESVLGPPSKVDDGLCSTIGKFKSQCFAAWFWMTKTIQVVGLAILFGVSKSTIRKWTKWAGLRKQSNIAVTIPRADGTGCPDPSSRGTWFYKGLWYTQMPNTYYNIKMECRPRHRRTDKRLRYALNTGKGEYERLYFDSWKAATKALQAGATKVFVRTNHTRYGKREWECEWA